MNNYYAEYETDRYIRERFFPNREILGTMAEIGAGPTSFLSMSKHFRESGWRCICVDPNPKFVMQHQDEGNEIYHYACSNSNAEEVDFQIFNTGWGPDHDGISYSTIGKVYPGCQHKPEIIKVKTITLDSLLGMLQVGKLDFLSIDTEGHEIEVMEGFDLEAFEPRVILLENFLHSPSYRNYMMDRGYRLDHQLDYNYIFSRDV